MAKFKSCVIFISLLIIGYTLLWREVVIEMKGKSYLDQNMTSRNYQRENLAREIYHHYEIRTINCTLLFENNTYEQSIAKAYHIRNEKIPLLENFYIDEAQNCTEFKRQRSYIDITLTEEEDAFPIAYSIMLYRDIEQAERLLRVIYRPQNYYCIHVDTKSERLFRLAVEQISKCFDNVFLSSKSFDVNWGIFTMFTPDIVCMEDLLKYKKWKYFINLTGQEFPLNTNADLVKILKTLNGSNSIKGTVKGRQLQRTEFLCNTTYAGPYNIVRSSKIPKTDARPQGITQLVQGSKLITASRGFVEFLVTDPVSLAFREWLNDTCIPDETYAPTLNHLPLLGVPGAYKGEPETHPISYPFITRYVHWANAWNDEHWPGPCMGDLEVRYVCIMSVLDLPILKIRKELFVNKFHLTYEPLALDCMEQYIWYRTADQMLKKEGVDIDTSYYANLPYVKNHV